MRADAVVDRARSLSLDLERRTPLPAGGSTCHRWSILHAVGREDLQVARLVEPHLDAAAIAAEAGRRLVPGRWYGVWASAPRPRIETSGDGSLHISGTQHFCSGAGVCDRSLVTVDVGDHVVLVDVDVAAGRGASTITIDRSGWRTSAFGATGTASVSYHRHPVRREDLIGAAGFYLDRPGFWHGAVGPAAVWAGGAAGLLDAGPDSRPAAPGAPMLLGEARALLWAMEAELRAAADDADAQPDDVDAARWRALVVRSLVERQCTAVIDLFGQLCGPRALALDAGVSARVQELSLYVRQVHRASDLSELGGMGGP